MFVVHMVCPMVKFLINPFNTKPFKKILWGGTLKKFKLGEKILLAVSLKKIQSARSKKFKQFPSECLFNEKSFPIIISLFCKHTWKKSGLSSSTLSRSGKAAFERPIARNTVALLKYVKKLSGSPSEINNKEDTLSSSLTKLISP